MNIKVKVKKIINFMQLNIFHLMKMIKKKLKPYKINFKNYNYFKNIKTYYKLKIYIIGNVMKKVNQFSNVFYLNKNIQK